MARRKPKTIRFLPPGAWFWREKAATWRTHARDWLCPYRGDPAMHGRYNQRLNDGASTNAEAIIDARACRAAAEIAHRRGLGNIEDMIVCFDYAKMRATVRAGKMAAVIDLQGIPKYTGPEIGVQVDIVDWLQARAA